MKKLTAKQREQLREAAKIFGREGGLASAASLTKEQRVARAKKAVAARIAKQRRIS